MSRKLLCVLLTAIMVLSFVQVGFAIEAVPPAETAVRVTKANPLTVIVTAAGQQPYDLAKEGKSLGLRFTTEDKIVSIKTHACSWGNVTGTFLVSFYGDFTKYYE